MLRDAVRQGETREGPFVCAHVSSQRALQEPLTLYSLC